MDLISSAEGLQLNQAFIEIKEPDVRRRIIDLVKVLGHRAGAYWRLPVVARQLTLQAGPAK